MSQQDLAPAPAKCAAAKGLSGDVLLCVDFDKVTGLDAKELTGWDFSNLSGCAGWTINSGKLQVKDYSTLTDSCVFRMPIIDPNDSDKVKYSGITLAIKQTLNISADNSTAQIFLGNDDVIRKMVVQLTGKQQRQQNIFYIKKTDLPTGLSIYQYLFKVTNSAGAALGQNWFIESLAVIGTTE